MQRLPLFGQYVKEFRGPLQPGHASALDASKEDLSGLARGGVGPGVVLLGRVGLFLLSQVEAQGRDAAEVDGEGARHTLPPPAGLRRLPFFGFFLPTLKPKLKSIASGL